MMRRLIGVLAVLAVSVPGLALAQADGAKVYQKCAGCHQAGGAGIPGVFPPLAGHAPEILKAKGGQGYLVEAVLFGLQGEIQVKGKKYNGAMQAFASQLNDDEIAAVLNHVLTSWGNDKALPKGHKPIKASDVKAHRDKKLTPQQVQQSRGKLGMK